MYLYPKVKATCMMCLCLLHVQLLYNIRYYTSFVGNMYACSIYVCSYYPLPYNLITKRTSFVSVLNTVIILNLNLQLVFLLDKQ